MKLDAEQQHVLNAIRSGGKRNRATPMEQKAAVAIGLVESGLRNLPGGDRDSQGWRQERKSLYKDPTNLQASVDRVYAEMRQRRGKYATAGDLAAAVQRPAAQYRGRYAAVGDQAQKLLGDTQVSASGVASSATNATSVASGPSVAEQRQGVLTNYLSQRGRPGSLVALAGGLGDIQAPAAPTVPVASRPGVTATGATTTGKVKIVGPNPGRLKPQLVSFAQKVAGIYGKPLTASDGTGHSYRTATGGVSQHSTGQATDIPASGAQLTAMGRAALIAAGMPRAQAMKQTGGLFNVNGHQIIFHDRKRVSGSPHDDHLHISAR